MKAENGGHHQLSVMVVDDDPNIGRLIKRNLEGNGTRIIEAASGLDCLETLHREKVDLLILDLNLPDFSGWGILSLLRLTASLRQMPVIVATVEPRDQSLVDRYQPDDYIQKPFDIRDLLLRVRRVIGAGSAAGAPVKGKLSTRES